MLRLRVGDRVEVIIEPTGAIYLGAIDQLGPPVTVEIQELLAQRQGSRTNHGSTVNLILGSIKPALEELVVEKAVELGVGSVTLFAAARSNRAPGGDRITARMERLTRIAEAAMKQSGTSRRPILSFYPSLSAALGALESAFHRPIICVAPQNSSDGKSETTDIKEFFSTPPRTLPDLAEVRTQPLEVIAEDVDFHILIGPEGGFSSEELALARTYRFQAVSLGSSVLRAETAAIVACGIVQLMRP